MNYPKQTWDANSYVNPTRMNHIEDGIKSAIDGLTDTYIEGSTNNTGSTIVSGKYFYLNGTLVRAKTNIANGATLTVNTNYEVVSAGALNALQQQLVNHVKANQSAWPGSTLTFNIPQSNIIIWHFVAIRNDGILCESNYILRSDGLIETGKTGQHTSNYSNGVLTITLPSAGGSAGYWSYSMSDMHSGI